MLSTFAEPFYLGSSTNALVGDEYQVAIAGHGYIIEPAQYRRRFLAQLRTVAQLTTFQDTISEIGEHTINPEGAWRRSKSDWSHGAGQTYLDSARDADEVRFHASKGIDPWSPQTIRMLAPTLRRRQSVSGTARVKVVSGFETTRGVYVLDSDGATDKVRFSADPRLASPTWTDCTGISGQCWDIATDGANVYVVAGAAGATKIYSRAMGGTALSALTGSAAAYVGVAYANGRLFAWKSDGSVVEILADGTESAVFTHRFGSAFTWRAVVGAPNATYLFGAIGNNTEIYQLSVKDATGGLAPPLLAAGIEGEAVTSAAFEGGLMIVGLSVNGGSGGNLRVAEVGASGSLTMGPLVLTDPTPLPVKCVAAAGRYVYFGWSTYDALSSGLGRLDLATFTSLLVPAYASDLMAGRSGATVQGEVFSTAGFGDTRLFTITGLGLWAEDDPTGGYTHIGSLTSGRIRFGLLDFKSFTSLDARLDALPASCRIVITVAFDDGTLSTVFDSSDSGTTGPARPVPLPREIHEWCEVTVTLSMDPTLALGPVVRWWVLRAVPTAGAVEQIFVPIILRTTVASRADGGATNLEFAPRDELDYLRGLVAARQIVTYQEGETSQDVVVQNLEVQPDRWSWDNRYFEGIVLVELRSLT